MKKLTFTDKIDLYDVNDVLLGQLDVIVSSDGQRMYCFTSEKELVDISDLIPYLEDTSTSDNTNDTETNTDTGSDTTTNDGSSDTGNTNDTGTNADTGSDTTTNDGSSDTGNTDTGNINEPILEPILVGGIIQSPYRDYSWRLSDKVVSDAEYKAVVGPWGGFNFDVYAKFDPAVDKGFSFEIKADVSTDRMDLIFYEGGDLNTIDLNTLLNGLPADYTKVEVLFDDYNFTTPFSSIVWKEGAGKTTSTIYLRNIDLIKRDPSEIVVVPEPDARPLSTKTPAR